MRHVFGYSLKTLTVTAFVCGLSLQVHAQPKLKGTDLLCNGESFFAASNICETMSKLAREDGVLSANESFKQVAVSGVPIATVMNQFKSANPKPKFVVTDGGGIDLMFNNCATGDENCSTIKDLKKTMEEYIQEMKKSGVKAFVWMGYPDPQGSNWATLKKGQDIWAVVAKKVVEATTEPKAYWIDMRDVWEGHYREYTQDGIHCTDAGGAATGKAFWELMKADNWAFFDTTDETTPVKHESLKSAGAKSLFNPVVRNGKISMTLSNVQSSNVRLLLMTVAGRRVAEMQQISPASSEQTIEFPLSGITPGVYICKINAGELVTQSMVMVR